MQGCHHFQIWTFNDVTAKHGQDIGTIHSKWQEIWQPEIPNMKATTRAEQAHDKKAEQHDYKVGQQIWARQTQFSQQKSQIGTKMGRTIPYYQSQGQWQYQNSNG